MSMLNENNIVEVLVAHLLTQGYRVRKACTTADRGVDIIAIHDDHELYIEAKGETSSREGSALYRSPFTDSQVKSHVSVVIFQINELSLKFGYFFLYEEGEVPADNLIGIAPHQVEAPGASNSMMPVRSVE